MCRALIDNGALPGWDPPQKQYPERTSTISRLQLALQRLGLVGLVEIDIQRQFL